MDQIKIGKFIAELRKQKGMTQKELAEKLSISDKTISKWECGKGMPDNSIMLHLCELLNITVNEFLSGEHLEVGEYNRKAEENIMNLIKKTEETKNDSKKTFILTMLSEAALLLIIVAIIAVSSGVEGAFHYLVYFIDYPSLIMIIAINTIMLITLKLIKPFFKSFVFLYKVDETVTYDDIERSFIAVKTVMLTSSISGILIDIIALIIILHMAGSLSDNVCNLAVACIGILYALIIDLFLMPVLMKLKLCKREF